MIVLSALAILIVTGIFNLMFLGAIGPLLSLKLVLVAVVMILAIYQYGMLGMRICAYPPMGLTRRCRPCRRAFAASGSRSECWCW